MNQEQTPNLGGDFEIDNLSISFGGLKAVNQFSLHLKPMELQGLIGPNGAGKTTCFNLITGVYAPDCGTMVLNGRSLVGFNPHQISKAGIARTFQNIRLFNDLTVLENVMVSYTSLGLILGPLPENLVTIALSKVSEAAAELLKVMGLGLERGEGKSLLTAINGALEIARGFGF